MTLRPVLVVSGASGLIGTRLSRAVKDRFELRLLTRDPNTAQKPGWITWNPEAASVGDEGALKALSATLSGAHAIVNLAGVSISDGRLDEAHRKRVLESRLQSTRALLLAQRRAEQPAGVWYQASATGYYGDRGDTELTERSEPGVGPLSDICRAWEAAPEDAGGARLVVGRMGTVLAREAESWKKLVLPIRLFAGGPLGSGQQWFPWIDADDLAEAILFLIEKPDASGVYNLTAPEPVRQLTFARAVAERLSRPAALPAPAFALRVLLGGLADNLILASAKVVPKRLERDGFPFSKPTLATELDKLLS